MRRRSRPSVRRSTTSSPTADHPDAPGSLRALIDRLPEPLRLLAFTHTSWVQRREDSYERLEFLGDGVLGLVIAHHLYTRFPLSAEGDLAKVRAHVVSRAQLRGRRRRRRARRPTCAPGARRWARRRSRSTACRGRRVCSRRSSRRRSGAGYLEFGLDAVAGPVVAGLLEPDRLRPRRARRRQDGAPGRACTSGGLGNVCSSRCVRSSAPALVHIPGSGRRTRAWAWLRAQQEGLRAAGRPRGARQPRSHLHAGLAHRRRSPACI